MKNILTKAAMLLLAAGALSALPTSATAQEAILAEIYGRGVHAFYSGQHQMAHGLFTDAINSGSRDPRAYYFRGITATMMGRSYEAESDWRQGATLEAQSQSNPAIGRSLSRFQGSARLKLEQIRQTARLQAMTTAATRSDVRINEIQKASPVASGTAAAPARPSVTPPPTPPADENPFANDASMAVGQPKVEADDALAGATGNPFADDGAAGAVADAAAPAGNDPFGGGGGDTADPFGGGGGDAAMDDPFGGGGDAADPFGGGTDMDDPFGN